MGILKSSFVPLSPGDSRMDFQTRAQAQQFYAEEVWHTVSLSLSLALLSAPSSKSIPSRARCVCVSLAFCFVLRAHGVSVA
jgi:hypothetical protein